MLWKKKERDNFTHPEICDYVALHHKVSTESDFLRNEKGVSWQFSLCFCCYCCAVVNGVTFHRIFRLVDPFVKVHILIIKLDRFFMCSVYISRPFFPLAHSSPPHVCTIYLKYDNIFMFLPSLRRCELNQVFLFEILPRGFFEWFLFWFENYFYWTWCSLMKKKINFNFSTLYCWEFFDELNIPSTDGFLLRLYREHFFDIFNWTSRFKREPLSLSAAYCEKLLANGTRYFIWVNNTL